MLPNIRAVFATIAVAVALLIIASGVVATFRIAQESRAGSLHADLAQRGHAVAPQPQPIVVIETPAPMLRAKAPEPAPPRAPQEQAPVRDDATLAEKDETAPVATPAPEPSAVAAGPSPWWGRGAPISPRCEKSPRGRDIGAPPRDPPRRCKRTATGSTRAPGARRGCSATRRSEGRAGPACSNSRGDRGPLP